MSGEHEHDNDPDARNEYLWDRSGPRDERIAELERLLTPLAWRQAALRPPHRAAPVSTPHAHRRRRRPWRAAVAGLAAAAVLMLGTHAWYRHRLTWPDAQPWQMLAAQGAVRIDGRAPSAGAALTPGSVLETGAGASVRLRAARIGEVLIGEGSRFVLTETRSGRHRTQLQQGRLWARVWAPPGAFGVSGPMGDVYDLGCEFVLEARADGSGALSVRSGWVQIDNAFREVLVPQGARVEFRRQGRPGTPYDLGAHAGFVAALRELDAQDAALSADSDSVRKLVALSRPQDAISLLSLLQTHPQLADGPVYDRLAALMPSEARVTRAAIRTQGPHALSPWWNQLPYPRVKRWWLQWPDAFAARGDAATLLRDDPR